MNWYAVVAIASAMEVRCNCITYHTSSVTTMVLISIVVSLLKANEEMWTWTWNSTMDRATYHGNANQIATFSFGGEFVKVEHKCYSTANTFANTVIRGNRN